MTWETFDIKFDIGKGGFGEVFQGEFRYNRLGDSKQYAIKRVPKSEVYKKRLMDSLDLEKRILQEADCPFITKLHFAFRDKIYLYFVMEMAEGGDTYSLIKPNSDRVDTYRKLG